MSVTRKDAVKIIERDGRIYLTPLDPTRPPRKFSHKRSTRRRIPKAIFEKMRADQNNCCKICQIPFDSLPGSKCHIDHDHDTLLVRGLLCQKCNLMIGYALERSEILASGIEYLRSYGK